MGKQRLLVALWTSTSRNPAGPSDDIDNRVSALEKAVKDAAIKFKDLIKQEPEYANSIQMFIAPEYFFGKARLNQTDGRMFEQNQKKSIVARICKLSLDNKNMLIIPGTVAWRRAVSDASTALKSQPRNRLTRAQDRVQENARFGRDVLVPGNGNDQAVADYFSKQDKERLDKLAADGKKVYLARNTAYIFYNGKILKYHKRGDFEEVTNDQDKPTVFIPGIETGQFSIGNVRFGIEICLDHDIGCLANSDFGGNPPHVHIITSNSVENNWTNAVAPLLLHASTDRNQSGAFCAPLHANSAQFDKVAANSSSKIRFLKAWVEVAGLDENQLVPPLIQSADISAKLGVMSTGSLASVP
jgi:predicted amidohydrolase